MLKIPKGLKKKKKGKKSKRKGEQELFTEEELEQYKREHQAQPQNQEGQTEGNQEHSEQSAAPPENDEWSKFNALTTGVDSILKKTQGDLDRIKSTSFFQRVPAGPKQVDRCGKDLPFRRDAQKDGQRWIGFEERKDGAPPQAAGESTQFQPTPRQEESVTPTPIEPVVSETESEEEDFDDIFDTSYVEAVEKGEVKLAYIPDSPEEEVDEGPDPFDTSYADKVIKGPEVSKKGKKLVNIGAAVEVLTGRIDHVTTSSVAVKKAKRRIPRDLLFETTDSDDAADYPVEETNARSILDDDTEIFDDAPVDLSVSFHTQFIHKETKEESAESKQRGILSDFDTIGQDDDDDEFAALACESLTKPIAVEAQFEVQPIAVSAFDSVLEDTGSWSAFEDSKPKPSRPPPPRPSSGPGQCKPTELTASPNFDPDSSIELDAEGPDPFDTTFADNILPGKAELKQIEDEILNSNDLSRSDSDFDFNPRDGEKPYINNRRQSSVHIHLTDPTGTRESISGYEQTANFATLKPAHIDLLGGSSTDLTQLADSPIAPSAIEDKIDYSDPFDTSNIDIASAPGKTELKFIEKELLGETELKRSLSDSDFDPRADDQEDSYTNTQRKPSRPENLFVSKAVGFKIPTEGDPEVDKDGRKPNPLTPYYAREASITDEEVDTQEDSFDASFDSVPVVSSKPLTGSILKNSQVSDELKRSNSNQDFNVEEECTNEKSFSQLRRHSDFPLGFSKTIDFSAKASKTKTDFLSITEEESVDTKVLTPYQESVDFDADPFDTSIISNILLPGKTELKFLESELLAQDSATNHLEDPDFDPRSGDGQFSGQPEDLLAPSDDAFHIKALTPQPPEAPTGFLISTEDDDVDPFDTSIADNLGPGKTELKLLESELIN